MEVCSDTIYYNNNWPSDITVNINGLEILTFTSPGNFGGKRGRLTPEYWPVTSSQFGQLKKISVDKEGVYLDNVFIHKQVTFDDLRLFEKNSISFTIGVKDDAEHCGGISIFGKNSVNLDMGITIRSMWVEDGRLYWQAGGGIVHDSDPDLEWREVCNKSAIMRLALQAEGDDYVPADR